MDAESPRNGSRGSFRPKTRKDLGDVNHDDGTNGNGNARDGCFRHGNASYGCSRGNDRCCQLDDGAPVQIQNGKVHGRHENYLFLRRCDGVQHGTKLVYDVGRRYVQLLHDDERYDDLLLQSYDGHVQMRNDQGRRLPHVHQRRRQMLRNDSGLLRLHGVHVERRLHLLHAHEQYAGLLRGLLSREVEMKT